MSNVLHRTTKQYRRSVNTPDFPTSDWIINPNLSSVQNVPVKYWKITDDTVSEMSQAEKDSADVASLPAAKIQKLAQVRAKSVQIMAGVLADLDPGVNVGEFQSSLNTVLRGKAQDAKALKDQIDSALTLAEIETISDDR